MAVGVAGACNSDKGAGNKWHVCVQVRVQGVWRSGAVTSHLLAHPRQYSVILDDGTRMDLKLPHERVRSNLSPIFF
jgi:hypothetical protein